MVKTICIKVSTLTIINEKFESYTIKHNIKLYYNFILTCINSPLVWIWCIYKVFIVWAALIQVAKFFSHFRYGHTLQKAPDPVWSPKLNCSWLSQYCGGGPRGNTECCTFYHAFFRVFHSFCDVFYTLLNQFSINFIFINYSRFLFQRPIDWYLVHFFWISHSFTSHLLCILTMIVI